MSAQRFHIWPALLHEWPSIAQAVVAATTPDAVSDILERAAIASPVIGIEPCLAARLIDPLKTINDRPQHVGLDLRHRLYATNTAFEQIRVE